MRRSFVTTTVMMALSLVPAALFAQQTPPAQQTPAQQTPAPPQPKEPRLAFTGDAGLFLYQIKPDQTAAFEELITKVKEGLGKSDNPVRKQQLQGWKIYKAAEPMGPNALYVMVADPAVKAAEYDLFMLLGESLGPDVAKPENQELFKKYTAAFAAGPNRLNLSKIAGGN